MLTNTDLPGVVTVLSTSSFSVLPSAVRRPSLTQADHLLVLGRLALSTPTRRPRPSQVLTDMDLAGVVSVLSTSGVASAWLMAHSLELLAAYPGAAAAGGGAGGGGGRGGGGGLLGRPLAVSGCDQVRTTAVRRRAAQHVSVAFRV